VFDAVQTCSTVAFDKTGTLTTGVMAASSMRTLQPHQPASQPSPSEEARQPEAAGIWIVAILLL